MLTALRDSDLEILRYCHELRFCTIDHLTALTGRHRQALHLRLQQLISEKYIYRIKFPNPNQKHIYTIGTDGFKCLAFHALISINDLPSRFRANELKPLFLSHTLLVTDIHTTFMLASRKSPFQLTDWREGKGIYDSVTFYENGRKIRRPVCPDGFFSIINTARPAPSNQIAFVLEADRSTTTRRTFDEKMRAYCQYLQQNRQMKMYGVDWFRVVTITLTRARAENLADLADQTVPPSLKKFFLFTSRENFSLEDSNRIYTSIYRTLKSDKPVSIMPF